MKNALLLLAFALASTTLLAQTRTWKHNLSAGGGFENYDGDMGNTYFVPGEEVYGFAFIGYNHYLNRSFDAGAKATFGEIGRCLDNEEMVLYNSNFMMRARMATAQLSLKYKFANGYLLRETAKVAPFVNLGAGVNYLTDIWDHARVNEGFYGSLNAGIGVQFNFDPRYNFTYHLGFGYFNSDKIDYKVQGGNDMYMQNTFTLGVNF